MSNILITGATGNVGFEVIRFLNERHTSDQVIAGVRNIKKAKEIFQEYPNLDYVHFDFENIATFDTALADVDRIFLLRPPHISDVDKYFRPFLTTLKKKHIREIVF